MKEIRIETLGCRLNQIESEAAANCFIESGFDLTMESVSAQTPQEDQTRLCILNTCTVTQKSEQKARRIIRLLLKKFPNSTILVTGCYAQLAPEEIKAIDNRIAVLGGQIKSRIIDVPDLLKEKIEQANWNPNLFAEFLNDYFAQKKQEKLDFPEQTFKLSTSNFLAHSRASLKIQDGCNSNCSYCAIHMARGHSVSIDVETALERVRGLENSGHEEVVITTVNIGQYRSEYKGQIIRFSGLLKILLEETKKINFRISSLYPEVVDEEFCQIIKNPRVRPHFHISVQSGSNNVLKAMNRNYKAEDVVKACNLLRSAKEKPFLACDIITGFPGETEEDFLSTLKLIEDCDFSWVHAFPYSERPGTLAATMRNKVPQSISGERAKKINQIVIQKKIEYINSFAGSELDVIVETARKPSLSSLNNGNLVYHGMSSNFIHVEFETNKHISLNKTVKVRIVKALEERIKKGGDIEALAKIL